MKKFFFFLAAALVAVSALAAPVDQTTAQRKAKSYLTNTLYAGKVMAPAALNPVLLKAEPRSEKQSQPVFYIYNTSTTFLVIAGDDRAEEILMVGDHPLRDINNLAPAMQDILNNYKKEINWLFDNPNVKVQRISEENKSLRAVTYGPLLTAEWDQEAPYYNQCKFTYNNRSYQCLTGCPATSAAMVMYYWKYPPSVSAIASYTSTLDIGSYYSNEVNFTYPALDATTFDWANMKDKYNSYTTAQGTAVATLMRYIGQAEQMMYGVTGSGIYTTETQKVVNMFKNWGYQSTVAVKYKSGYNETNWAALIQGELAAGRPLIYNGVDNSAGGHAFNVDGYRDSDSKYHVNFGWSGDGNSWYSMNSFTYSGYTFSSSQQAVIGIQAPGGVVTTPELTVNPTSLSFTGNTGETYTKTFTVTGTDLQGDVTITKTSGSAYFTVSPTTLTAAQAAAGATVTVTYKPTASGSQTGTITVSSTNAESKTVSLTGSSTTVPKLTVDPASLSLSTTVGTPVTKTFVVTGTNLTSGTSVSLTCSGTGFSIDKTNITRTAAQQGATVTVTFSPTASGSYSGTVTLKCTGAEDAIVTLNGTAVGTPTIVANPTSLSFNTPVGETVTKTFTVTGTDLTSNIMLAVTGNGFSIDKSSITINEAANGATVTVTYAPTAGGSTTGSVALSSNGAQQVLVALNGTATTTPTITANPTTLDFVTTVGTPVTKAFVLNSAYLEGNVTLAVEGEGFTIDKTEIIPGAANNAYVNVTYTPTTFGTHTGTVTITSPNAQPVTVTLNGQADLVKYAPVMLPANETYINLTKFRADWTDETLAENVASYTLEVSLKPTEPEPEVVELLSSINGTSYTNQSYQAVTLPAPWSGNNVYGGYGAIYFRNATHQSATTDGYIKYTIPAGYENKTFTVKLTTANTNYGSGRFVVGSTQTASVQYNFSASETHSWVVTGSTGDVITITSPENQYSPDIALIEVYSGDATVAKFMATETGDATYRLITGITDKFYTVNDLTAEGTFLYKVKAIYIDGTESDWSNIEEVTLFENGHGYQRGDVNHDGVVNITDVTMLINAVVGGTEICPICSDFNEDGITNITDVTMLISYMTSVTSVPAPKGK